MVFWFLILQLNGFYMEQWFTRLISNFPHLSADGIRLLLFVDRKGPLVPVSSLSEELNWDKPRIAKAIIELVGKSQKKSWINRNSGTNSPALIREDVDPSDLRAKTISLTPMGTSFARPEKHLPPPVDLASVFARVRSSILDKSNREVTDASRYVKNPCERDHFIANSRALSDIALLSLKYLESRAEGLLLTKIEHINSLLSWITVDALWEDSQSGSLFSALAMDVFDRISRDKIDDENEEIERVAKIIGFTHANIKFHLNRELGYFESSESELDKRIELMNFETFRNQAIMCRRAYSLFKCKVPAQDTFFYDRYANSAIQWLIIVDKFRSSSTLDISNVSADDIYLIAKGQTYNLFIHASQKDNILSDLRSYIYSFPESDFAHWHQRSLDFINISSYLFRSSPIANITYPLLSSLDKTGYSAFINCNLNRDRLWIINIVKRAITSNIIPIVYNPLPSTISFLHSNGFSTSKLPSADDATTPCDILIYEDSDISDLSLLLNSLANSDAKSASKFLVIIQDSAKYISEAQIDIPRLIEEHQIHIHFLFERLPIAFSPFSDTNEVFKKIEFASAFWNGLKGLGLGLIDEGDYQFLYQWCLVGIVDIPPLNFTALNDMPVNRIIDFNKFGWEPKPLSQN